MKSLVHEYKASSSASKMALLEYICKVTPDLTCATIRKFVELSCDGILCKQCMKIKEIVE